MKIDIQQVDGGCMSYDIFSDDGVPARQATIEVETDSGKSVKLVVFPDGTAKVYVDGQEI